MFLDFFAKMEWLKSGHRWIPIRSLEPLWIFEPTWKIEKFIVVTFDCGIPNEAINTEKKIQEKTLQFFRDHSYITYASMFISFFFFLEEPNYLS